MTGECETGSVLVVVKVVADDGVSRLVKLRQLYVIAFQDHGQVCRYLSKWSVPVDGCANDWVWGGSFGCLMI